MLNRVLLGVIAGSRNAGPESDLAQELVWVTEGESPNVFITDGGRTFSTPVGASSTWHKAKVPTFKPFIDGGKYYYEVYITDGGAMAIGVAPNDVDTKSGASSNSNAGTNARLQYFQDGRKRRGGVYSAYGPTYSTGSTIGVGISYVDTGVIDEVGEMSVRVWLNGVDLGVMYTVQAGTSSNPTDYEARDEVPHVCIYGGNAAITLPEFVTNLPAGYQLWKS